MIQQEKKWKPPVFTYVLLFIFALYLSLVLAATYHVGDSIYAFAPRLTKLFKETPFTFSYISALRNTKVFLVSLTLYTVESFRCRFRSGLMSSQILHFLMTL